jgi:hypothetical protein
VHGGAALPPSGPTSLPVPSALSRTTNQTEPLRARAPTPSRVVAPGGGSVGTPAPVVSRTQSAGVVVTRPALIVGAPKSSSGQTVPRIRKAREDEGRGFGQGLISEKSLDEVILAYLSEDADDK